MNEAAEALIGAEFRNRRVRRNEREFTNMAHKAPVHIERKENGWAVVREGSGRATSIHPTQHQAAEAGRELARRDGTEFFLHAQDGRVREHRNYAEGFPTAPPEDEGIVDRAAGIAGTLTGGVTDAAALAVGAAGRAVPTEGNALGQRGEALRCTAEVGSGGRAAGRNNDDENIRVLHRRAARRRSEDARGALRGLRGLRPERREARQTRRALRGRIRQPRVRGHLRTPRGEIPPRPVGGGHGR